MRESAEWISEFNRVWRDNDKIYRDAAKAMGISECVFWILYSLRENKDTITQREIVEQLSIPPQTVNSALKKLEADGYVLLKPGSDRRSKLVCFTEKGRTFAAGTVDQVLEAEQKSVEELSEEEKTAFLKHFTTYTNLLKNQIQKLEKEFLKGQSDFGVNCGKSGENVDKETGKNDEL